jgi:hypothetical protein
VWKEKQLLIVGCAFQISAFVDCMHALGDKCSFHSSEISTRQLKALLNSLNRDLQVL